MSAQVIEQHRIDRDRLIHELLFVVDPRLPEFFTGLTNGNTEGLIVMVPINEDGSVNQDIQRMVTAWGHGHRALTFKDALENVCRMFTDVTQFVALLYHP